ncbi:MAG: hypothetical protein ACI9E3_000367, partial [Flavobacteriales bacterium]
QLSFKFVYLQQTSQYSQWFFKLVNDEDILEF